MGRRGWPGRGPWAALVLLVLVGACTSFGDGNAPSHPSGEDAGAPLGDAAGEGAARPFCENVDRVDLVLCDGFDDREAVAPWRGDDADAQTRYALTREAFVSPPQAAHLEILPGSGSNQDARLRYIIAYAKRTWISASLKVRIDARDDTAELGIVRIAFGLVGELRLDSSGTVTEGIVADGGNERRILKTFGRLESGTWHSVELVASLDDLMLDMSVDGAKNSASIDATKLQATASALVVGPAEAPSPTKGWVVHADDVILRAR